MSIDIGGTLAKTAFYVPAEHQKELEKNGRMEALTKDTIPSKFSLIIILQDPRFSFDNQGIPIFINCLNKSI